MKHPLCTIGYEGTDVGQFIETLTANRINVLLDIREAPISRKKGFAKAALEAALRAHDIGYVHLKGLGTPKEGRDAARAGNRSMFERVFAAQLRTAESKRDLGTAIGLAGSSKVCLMCFEKDYRQCHRSIVADLMTETTGQTIRHLEVPAD